jgi:hypothetical protein
VKRNGETNRLCRTDKRPCQIAVRRLNVDRAIVPREKLTEYLLSDTHVDGRPKAEFYRLFGFSVLNWQELAQALLNHAAEHDIVAEETSPFGIRYVIEGPLTAADGRRPNLRSIWFIEMGKDAPRLVTAYPLRGKADD